MTMTNKAKIVIIGCEDTIQSIVITFQIHSPESELFYTTLAEKGLGLIEAKKPDVVILEMDTRDIESHDLIQRMRLASNVPILVLSAITDEADIVKCIELGADDFVNRPFRQIEILARVNALLRERHGLEEQATLRCGPIFVDTVDQRYIRGELRLTSGARNISF